jgi:3-oxoadipate enol-lactonase
MTTLKTTARRAVVVGTATVSYAVDGAGPSLVLVHGAAGSADANWAHLVEGFAADRTVVRPDYAGSGATRDHGGRLEIDELVVQVAAAAEDARAAPFELVGFSLGAAVAASLAAQRPDLVRSLVLLGGFASTTADARSQIQFSLWRRLFDTDRDVLARLGVLTVLSPAFLAGMTPAELEEAIVESARTMPPGTGRQADLALRVDIAAQLASISAPTLVIGQTRDHVVPVELSRALHAAIPSAAYAELDTGHLGLLEQPDLVTATIREFLTAGRRPLRRRSGTARRGAARGRSAS